MIPVDLLDFADNIAPGGYGTESEEDLEDEEMDFSDMEELSGDDDQDMSEVCPENSQGIGFSCFFLLT